LAGQPGLGGGLTSDSEPEVAGDKIVAATVAPGNGSGSVAGAAGKAATSKALAEDQPPDRQTSEGEGNFEDMLMNLKDGTAASRAKQKPKERQFQENANCPFSEEDMDSTATVDLRCGHRFALARLNAARRGPTVCASAGFALREALICPLCGDQDITTMPGAQEFAAPAATGKKMLTCYSTDTDAYLGELRKDWQRPLHLPMQAGTETGTHVQKSSDPSGGQRATPEPLSLPAVRKKSQPSSGKSSGIQSIRSSTSDRVVMSAR